MSTDTISIVVDPPIGVEIVVEESVVYELTFDSPAIAEIAVLSPATYQLAVTPPPETTLSIMCPCESSTPGVPGAGNARYVHQQTALAKVWSVFHNLGTHPSVDVEDAVGNSLFGSILYLDDNSLTITFTNALTGRANCI